MKYELAILSGSAGTLELSPDEFIAIREARRRYLSFLDIEEKFDIVLEAFFEFERTRLELALRQTTTFHLPHEQLASDIRLVNRRLLNVLAACKLYNDQLRHDFAALYGQQSEPWARFETRRSVLRESNFACQVLVAVRDHLQHRGLAVDTLFFQLVAKHTETERRAQVITDPYLAVGRMKPDRNIPAGLIERLQQQPQPVALTPLVKEYIGCLAELHEGTRTELATDVRECLSTLRDALDRSRSAFPGARLVAAVATADDGAESESHQVFDELLALRELLLRKNALLSNLARRFVSSEQS